MILTAPDYNNIPESKVYYRGLSCLPMHNSEFQFMLQIRIDIWWQLKDDCP